MSVRAWIERQQMEKLYQEQERKAQQPAETAEQAARVARLAANAKKIRENQIQNLLLDMSDVERECVFSIVGRDKPECLGSAEVISATLLRVRTEGAENLKVALQDATPEEQEQVGARLRHESAEAQAGMDGGATCREILRQVRSENYLED
jgi:hypothetical protein